MHDLRSAAISSQTQSSGAVRSTRPPRRILPAGTPQFQTVEADIHPRSGKHSRTSRAQRTQARRTAGLRRGAIFATPERRESISVIGSDAAIGLMLVSAACLYRAQS